MEISQEYYDELVERSIALDMITYAIYTNSTLAPRDGELILDGYELSRALKYVDSYNYNKKVKELEAKIIKEEGDDDNV